MNLKKARKISDILYMATIGLIGLMMFMPTDYRICFAVGIFATLIAQWLFSTKYMRCPHCGNNVGRYDTVCRTCSRSLDSEPKIRNRKKEV